ncbi:ABC transporter ATP-binding protein [Clostridium beijerinckii]|uniref:ABC transporter ATP-binding protein n=1 Tax=Clostridium beijerinckii TaxID=1520 RepID=UPI0020C6A62C
MTKNNFIKAVDGVSFYIRRGETFGLVGESGCGKSTLGRTITRLYDVTSGDIFFEENNIAKLRKKQMKQYYKKIQTIFQDPYSSLNPYMNVKELIEEPLTLHTGLNKLERKEKIENLLEMVGLKKDDMDKFPHEFSGGQCQRIGIARAISTNPDFVLCDEPISALDVSIQAQVVNMLEDLQKEMGLTYLFVAHDLSMVKHISDRIGVMYLGSIVEVGKSDDLYKNPLHPYTKGLLSSIPIADPIKARQSNLNIIKGDIPSPMNIPSGCRFHTRCPYAKPICSKVQPIEKEIGTDHIVACHLY